ncbi:MAG: caspase family protein [Pseudomonadota bacterium]
MMPSLINEDLDLPGTHALVIGISEYPHISGGKDPTPDGKSFNLGQLTSAARSASEFAGWLLKEYRNPDLPLKSLRVLLSPSANENIHPDILAKLPDNHSATRQNVTQELVEFRTACNTHKENVAFVYIAGHGVQLTKHGSVVLLNDFAQTGQLNRLHGAIDMARVHAGMNHPDTAQTQFWFIDACRQKPAVARKFESMAGALVIDEPVGVAQTSLMFLSATTGKSAYGKPGGCSLFCEALMWSLRDAGAAEGPGTGCRNWHVPVTSLIRRLPEKVSQLAASHNASQPVDIAGKIHEAVLHIYSNPPKVDLCISLIPKKAQKASTATLTFNGQIPVISNSSTWPVIDKVDAGLYLLSIKSTSPYSGNTNIHNVTPPEYQTQVEV